MTKKNIRDFWISFTPNTTPATTPINNKFWKFFSKEDQILEVGSAWGRIIYECLKHNLLVTGIDINEAEVSNLQRKIQEEGISDKVNLFVESVTQMHFLQNTFDGVFLQGLLSAISQEERLGALRETFRVLKPEGHIHVAEFELDEDNSKVKERYKKDMKITGEHGTVSVTDKKGKELFRSHNFRQSELISLITREKFKVIDISRRIFTTFKGKKKPGIIVIAQK